VECRLANWWKNNAKKKKKQCTAFHTVNPFTVLQSLSLGNQKKKAKEGFLFLSDFLWKQVKEGDESHRSRWTGLGGETKEPKKKKTGKLTVGE
jgi:hypothetical protein